MDSKIKSIKKSTIRVGILILLLFTSCTPEVSRDTEQLILNMRNSDVGWNGNFVGLMPMSFSGATYALQSINEPIEPLLVEAILDEDRYIAAHVLLTTRLENHFTFSADEWNGLHVQLYADGRVSYDGNDLNELHQHWIERLKDTKEQ